MSRYKAVVLFLSVTVPISHVSRNMAVVLFLPKPNLGSVFNNEILMNKREREAWRKKSALWNPLSGSFR